MGVVKPHRLCSAGCLWSSSIFQWHITDTSRVIPGPDIFWVDGWSVARAIIGRHVWWLWDTWDRSLGPNDKERGNDIETSDSATIQSESCDSRSEPDHRTPVWEQPCLRLTSGDYKADQRADCFDRRICRLVPRRPGTSRSFLIWASYQGRISYLSWE